MIVKYVIYYVATRTPVIGDVTTDKGTPEGRPQATLRMSWKRVCKVLPLVHASFSCQFLLIKDFYTVTLALMYVVS